MEQHWVTFQDAEDIELHFGDSATLSYILGWRKHWVTFWDGANIELNFCMEQALSSILGWNKHWTKKLFFGISNIELHFRMQKPLSYILGWSKYWVKFWDSASVEFHFGMILSIELYFGIEQILSHILGRSDPWDKLYYQMKQTLRYIFRLRKHWAVFGRKQTYIILFFVGWSIEFCFGMEQTLGFYVMA